MSYKTTYWDMDTKQQLERDCTPEEIIEIDLRRLPEAIPVPKLVSMRQARLALLQANLLDNVEEAIQTAGQAAKIEWEYAQEVQRSSGLVPTMATALGMTEAQLDELFILAATL